MDYYSAIKMEILIHAWMNLENIMLSELSHTTKGQILYDSTTIGKLATTGKLTETK